MSIPLKTIEEIKIKADIVEIIEKFLPSLRKSGKNYLALCPFHPEKTPSFTVNRQKGIFRCFGCQKSGDVFKFIQLYENLTWPESVKRIGEMVGVEVREIESPQERENVKIYDALSLVAGHYQKLLFETYEGKNALEYLKSRGLTEETIQKFQIGFSRGDAMQVLLKAGVEREIIARSGLVKISDGDSFEYMSGRIVFPIKDLRGRIIAFGGRSVDEARQPKYLNSPESPIFTKGKNLYGFSNGLEAIRKSRELIVVEGYMDVVIAHQHGLQNTVSCLGVAFTNIHASIISKYVERVALIFDPDDAGVKAAIRASENLYDTEIQHFIVSLPNNRDPDEFIITHGANYFVDYIRKNKKNYFEFHCDYLIRKYGADSPDKKIRILREIAPNISKLKSPIMAQDALRILSGRLNIDANLIAAEYENIRKKNYQATTDVITLHDVQILSREETLINLLVHNHRHATKFSEEMFFDKRCLFVWRKIAESASKGVPFDVKSFLDEIPEEMKTWFMDLIMREINVDPDECIEKIFEEMNLAVMKSRQRILEEEVKSMLTAGRVDKKKYDEYKALTSALKRESSLT